MAPWLIAGGAVHIWFLRWVKYRSLMVAKTERDRETARRLASLNR